VFHKLEEENVSHVYLECQMVKSGRRWQSDLPRTETRWTFTSEHRREQCCVEETSLRSANHSEHARRAGSGIQDNTHDGSTESGGFDHGSEQMIRCYAHLHPTYVKAAMANHPTVIAPFAPMRATNMVS
jgi:hypothetical protein